jgi:hypothetical protein
MNKPSERIVVFVTPAQKRAISATADGLGISISELMRRAVLAFSATGDQVKAASIVDRLNAPREPDPIDQVLRKAAKPLRERRASPLRPAIAASAGKETDADALAEQGEAKLLELTTNHRAEPAAAETQAATLPSPLAIGQDVSSAARDIAQAVTRLSAQTPDPDAALSDTANAVDDKPLQSLIVEPIARATRARSEANVRRDDPGDGLPEDGKFA